LTRPLIGPAHTAQGLPYRPCVGVMLINREGLVLVGRRKSEAGPEHVGGGYAWQMPQGGIDPAEDPEAAAKRELWEETGVTSVAVLGQVDEWLTYDFPPYEGPPHKLAAFRGQRQRWFAMRFLGDDAEIDLNAGCAAEEPEFDAWRWERLAAVPDLVVPFKRAIYRRVAEAFRAYAEPTA
jgi:putative (di)nucleoside polyphosphate hydrolase